jgi:hypothetical protein
VGLGKRAKSCNGDTSHSLNEMGRGMLRPYKGSRRSQLHQKMILAPNWAANGVLPGEI